MSLRSMSPKRVVILVIVLALLIWGAFFLYRQLQIDDCLDGGGRWDYQNQVCDY